MIAKLQRARLIWSHFGSRWIFYRIGYALRQRLGQIERDLPIRSWHDHQLTSLLSASVLRGPEDFGQIWSAQPPQFFFSPQARPSFNRIVSTWDAAQPLSVEKADRILNGWLTYFGHRDLEVGFPPRWHWNPLSSQELPTDRHWSKLSEFAYGDIKGIWEASRFSFVFTLVRAYWRSGDERYAKAFWESVLDWRQSNPPQAGPNWKCGQETSLRVLAWCFGLYGFLESPETTSERIVDLIQMIAVSGERIEHNLEYALSQRNNHAVSEATGLWTIGLLFPQLKDASRWKQRGRELLEKLAHDLIYDDGSFVQHSVNYHRLMLQAFLWSIRLGEVNQSSLSESLVGRVATAAEFLFELQESTNGKVPNYGANDGALLLPLTDCDYTDYRPVLQAAFRATKHCRLYPKGLWDEEMFWLYSAEADPPTCGEETKHIFSAEEGGYYVMRGRDSHVMTRCVKYRDRPSQADMLHVDLWWKGQNIAIDAGTYSYNASVPWNNSLAGTAYHNSVTVDGKDQMHRQSRFMWLPWAKGQLHHFVHSQAEQFGYWEGEHDGYQRLKDPVLHRRAILYLGGSAELWIVADLLSAVSNHQYRLHWLFNDFAHIWNQYDQTLQLETAAGSYFVHLPIAQDKQEQSQLTLARADPDSPRGWQSPYYAVRIPALSLTEERIVVEAPDGSSASSLFLTCFSDQPIKSSLAGSTLGLQWGDTSATIRFDRSFGLLVKSFLYNGTTVHTT